MAETQRRRSPRPRRDPNRLTRRQRFVLVDVCTRCDAFVVPDVDVLRRGGYVQARYRCVCGRSWRCWWASSFVAFLAAGGVVS
jgi:hypothetical protein